MKFGEKPGDIPRRAKIAMWEHPFGRTGAKGWKKMILAKERAVLNRRTRREIHQQLEGAETI